MKIMRGFLLMALKAFFAGLFTAALPLHAADAPLKFGIFPNLSPRILVETYRPVVDALSRELGRPVEMQTSPDFKTFHERTQAGEYDLVLTAPHLAWLAYSEAGYLPLLVYQRETEGILVTRADSAYKSPEDLKGKTISVADPLAITVMRLESELARAGLAGGRDYRRLEVSSHNNAALYVIEHKTDAAIMGGLPFQRLPEDMRKQLRIIKTTKSFPSQVYLTNPRIPNSLARSIRDTLKDFMRTPAGKTFLAQGGFDGLRNMSGRELRQFETDGQQVLQKLDAERKRVLE